ncbi:UDP-glucosyltransferase 2, partial [Gonioctena quinquepunctata]
DVYMELEKSTSHRNIRVLMDKLTYLTNRILSQPRIQELAQSGKHFDLIIQDALLKDAELYFGYIFKAPVILTSAVGTQNTINYLVNNPGAPAYVPGCGLAMTDEMNFWERVQNVVYSWYFHVNLHFHSMQQEEFLKTYFNDTPSIEELRENIALILSNAHPSFQSPRPRSPNIIDVGGIHIGEPEPLPADLQKYMDSAKEGVILFTMGSHIRTAVLPEETIKCIIEALSRIPQKVLLKWETNDIPIASKNILTRRWFPQTSVLAHPNLKAIVTHGGLNTKIEAIYFGVPMIGVPLCMDQRTNVAHSVAEGIAIRINLRELSETTLHDALTEIINNSSYRANIRTKSQMLRDQPMKPIDVAIYWIEYVMKFNGTRHLQNKGVKLYWFQNDLLDVAAFFLFISILIIWILFKVLHFIFESFRTASLIRWRKNKTD